MHTDAATYQRRLRKEGTWHKPFTRSNSLRRFHHFIEKSDWVEVIHAQEESINRMCIGVIILAALYFLPPVLTILFFR